MKLIDENSIQEKPVKKEKPIFLIILLIFSFVTTFFFYLNSKSLDKEVKAYKALEIKKNEEIESYKEKIDELEHKTETLINEKDDDEKLANSDVEDEIEVSTSISTPTPVGRDYEYSTKEIKELSETQGYEGEKIAFLTFDDGPNNEITPAILDILKEKDAKATFFMIGKSIGDYTSDVVKRVIDEGNSIGLHSFSHDYDYLYPNGIPNADVIKEEYHQSIEALRNILGKDYNTSVFRYPGGHLSWNPEGLEKSDKALRDLGIEWVDWNTMNGDAQITQSDNPNEVLRPNTVEEAVNNFEKSKLFTYNPDIAIILMHDASDKRLTLEALPSLIDHLREQGYKFGTLI